MQKKKMVCYLHGQGHSEGSYDQNLFLLHILTAGPFATKLGFMVL